MYIAMESGIGVGALISGFVYANKSENFPLVFSIAGIFSLAAFCILVFLKNKQKELSKSNG
jgi:predicted MFS family arabinose efflux permease